MKINIFTATSEGEDTGGTHLYKQVIATIASSMLCLSAGLTAGISAVLLPQLVQEKEFYWDIGYGSWMAAVAPMASIFGCLCAGSLLDRFGRKLAHIFLAFPFISGWLAMALAGEFYVMLAGRFFTGFSLGAVRPTTIIYLGEICDPGFRGIALLCPSLALNFGILLSHVIGTMLYWRTALLICLVPNVIHFAMLFNFKESPYWLISKGRVDEGIQCFRWFRGKSEVAENELRAVLEKHKDKGSSFTFKEFLTVISSRSFFKPMVTVFFVFCTVQLCGVNAFPFYAHDLIQKMFKDEFDTFLLMVITDSIRVVVSIVICMFGKMINRKMTFMSCAYGTTFILSSMVIFLIFKTNHFLTFIPLTLLVFYIAIASCTVSLGWTFVAEIFPTNIRGLGSGLSGVLCYSLLSLCVKITPSLLDFGEPVMYGTFASVTFICTVILSFILPETNGRRLQDIEDSYINNNKTTTL